jgi:uncharacterized protein (DUF924 family)
MSRQMTPRSILDFWFDATSRTHWFVSDATFDARVRALLQGPLEEATQGRLDFWRGDADGALALCLLFDQAPRNIFRGTAEAFATDPQARDVARHILSCGFDLAYESDEQRAFAYLPFEHSEELADQDLSLRLYTERAGDPAFQRHARQHREIIARFGRFPHRNAVLGRVSTAAELAFLSASSPYT